MNKRTQILYLILFDEELHARQLNSFFCCGQTVGREVIKKLLKSEILIKVFY